MADLENLKKRKEQLELERDIARLEREARVGHAVSEGVSNVTKWSWKWVAPLTALGLWWFLMGTFDMKQYQTILYIIGGVLLIPFVLKLLGNK